MMVRCPNAIRSSSAVAFLRKRYEPFLNTANNASSPPPLFCFFPDFESVLKITKFSSPKELFPPSNYSEADVKTTERAS